MVRFLIVLCAVVLLQPAAQGQFSYFGRNKVQYTEFDWHVLRTEHFDISYDRDMADIASGIALAVAEISLGYLVIELLTR
jgi:hypothetical protein